MADEKKVTETETKPAKPEKVKEQKPKFTERMSKIFRDYKSEFKKIVWPTWNYTLKQSGMIIIAIVLISASIFAVDTLFSKLLGLLVNIVQ